MGAVPILFSTSGQIGAQLIRRNTWGKWSHVAGIDERQQEVIEAVWPRVRIISLEEWLPKHPQHVISYLPAADPLAVVDAARSQEGKPYDLAGALGLGFHRDWQDDSKWWCSELWGWAFDEGGSPLFRPESVHRVTPEHMWMISPAAPPPDLHFFPTLEGRVLRPSSFLEIQS